MMGHRSEMATPDHSDEESGDAFTDGDFGDSDDETILERGVNQTSDIPINETVNEEVQQKLTNGNSQNNGYKESHDEPKTNGIVNSEPSSDLESGIAAVRRDSHGDQNPSIVGIIGDQHSHVGIRFLSFFVD